MAALNLYTSNRLEILIGNLADLLQTPLAHPLQKEVVVVQSKGMERWICLELARRQGIAANIRFPFPGHFVAEVFRAVIPDAPLEENPFDPAVMAWDIMVALPPLLAESEFELLRHYLKVPDADVRLFQLSTRIADMFDHYLLFRPDMILGWEAGKDHHWQAVLWRTLSRNKGRTHLAALRKDFFLRIREGKANFGFLPERISLFGISALPPFHIEIFAAISELVGVNLFLMNPCGEYWGDVVSERDMTRLTTRRHKKGLTPAELYLEKGNSLLSSLGAQGRDCFELINSCSEINEQNDFYDPGEDTLLWAIQSDILNLRERGGQGRMIIDPDDRSLQIHSCHSPMREIEVLQDQLLALFACDPALKPADILVMTPDINLYAPFIQAVFSLPKEDPRWMPFSIADRGLRQESTLVDYFLKLLDMPESRFGAAQVFDFLDSACVRDRFLLSESDLEVIHTWIEATGIRWGIDAGTRAAMDLPADRLNTWSEGLDRMLLGYALPIRNGGELFQGLLPFGEIEGSDTVILENLITFADHLFAAMGALTGLRTFSGWSEFLTVLLETFFAVDQETYARDVQAIRQALQELSVLEASSSCTDQVSLGVIKAYLSDNLETRGFGHGFLTGGITFCAMLPMRSIPFRVVCLVGLDDDAYPRKATALGFDLMARHPKPGDRSRREDDRYLFLEALLSARQVFYASYVGQSIDDNSSRPPSVLVSELLDYIEEGFFIPEQDFFNRIVAMHPLQAFSPAYFTPEGKLFSYSGENFRAAERMATKRRIATAFIAGALPEPAEEWQSLEVEDLCRFFANPARYLLTRRLGIHLDSESLLLNENEPFSLEGLEKYDIRLHLATQALADKDLQRLHPVLTASGRLPHGTPGALAFDHACRFVTDFVDNLRPFTSGGQQKPLDVDLTIGPFHLSGRINTLYPCGSVLFRPARIKARDYLRAWIYHLILHQCGATKQSILIFEDHQLRFVPVDDGKTFLEELLRLYLKGLSDPLKLFPESSLSYAKKIAEGAERAKALKAARSKWDSYVFPEKEDAAYRLCFCHTDPLDEEFMALAAATMGPLLQHLEPLP